MGLSFFGGVSAADFLSRYWQKKPLLIRNAFPGFQDPVSANELAGLSCERDVESRLVMERGGGKPWEVRHGPQKASRLKALPRSHWTLLVQGVDRFVPGVAALLEKFRFIPDWRVDDVMVSFAAPRGTVGPHTDSYDVFLIQGKGKRRWGISQRGSRDLKQGLDLRILKRFIPEREWVLEAGDMLYLPPGVAHFGLALSECLTYSVGFRAPGAMDLLSAAIPRLARLGGAERRYGDPDLRPSTHPGEIPRSTVQKMRRMMEDTLRSCLDEDAFNEIAGEILTEPKLHHLREENTPPRASAVRKKMETGCTLMREPGIRLAFIHGGGRVDLFADGRRWPLSKDLAFAGPLLTDHRSLPSPLLKKYLKKRGFLDLLAQLIGAGIFRLIPPLRDGVRR